MKRHFLITLLTTFLFTLTALAGLLFSALPIDAARAASLQAGAAAAPAAQPAWRSATGCQYTIRRGDNLFRIGLRYGVSYTFLASLNGIPNPNLIYAGSVISVPCGGTGGAAPPPANCAPSQTYTVKPGDNLFRIALNHESTIDWIRSANNLYGRVLRPGMNLTIPCPGSVKYRQVPPPGEQPTPAGPTETETPPPPAAGANVAIQDNSYSPNSIQIKVGTTVQWTNNGAAPHTVTSGTPGTPSGVFDSGPINPGGTFSYTFNSIGIYDYYSTLQPGMVGKVTVVQ